MEQLTKLAMVKCESAVPVNVDTCRRLFTAGHIFILSPPFGSNGIGSALLQISYVTSVAAPTVIGESANTPLEMEIS